MVLVGLFFMTFSPFCRWLPMGIGRVAAPLDAESRNKALRREADKS
jgi:hypothetical protein